MHHEPPFNNGQTMVATFILAGFDSSGPAIYSVTVEIDRDDFSVIPGRVKHENLLASGKSDGTFYMPAGSVQTAISPILKNDGSEFRRIPVTAQFEVKQVRSGLALSAEQSENLMTTLITEEIAASCDTVGWPIWFGSVPVNGRATLRRIIKPKSEHTRH